MDEELERLSRWFSLESWPSISCPSCHRGRLTPGMVGDQPSVQTHESASSRRLHNHPNWNPESLSGIFHGTLHCTSSTCGDVVGVVGEFEVSVDVEDDGEWRYYEFGRLRFATPPLVIMDLPTKTPEPVRQAIEQAAAILFSDPGSAANRLRVAVEELLTAARVRRFSVNKGRRSTLTAHARIELFTKKSPETKSPGEALMAVKWIGNEGSHQQRLSVAEVLEGAELLEHALRLLYDDSDVLRAKKIAAINRRKGLPRKEGSKG